jgi:hypothetical protein
LRGFEAAVTNLNKVILAEVPVSPQRFHSVVLVAADNVFDIGSAVIAPVGNTRAEVFAPAFARRVIASGALNVEIVDHDGKDIAQLTPYNEQGFGPTPDGRHKPELQAPTNLWAAANCGHRDKPDTCTDDALLRYEMTSGATPYTAAAASLLRDFLVLASENEDIRPGHVYAQLILAGQHIFPFPDSTGAGLIRLPPLNGVRWWGHVVLANGQTVDIPLRTSNTAVVDTIDAALWWPNPEQYLSSSAPGNDIDLKLVDERGIVRAHSSTERNTFERTRAVRGNDGAQQDYWTLRIEATTVQEGPQTVYWAAHGRPETAGR